MNGEIANLYVLVGSDDAIWDKLKVGWAERKLKIDARNPDLIREVQAIPEDIRNWKYELVSFDADKFEQDITFHRISSQNIGYLPDTCDWNPLRIVSSRLRDFLEEEDPEGGLYYPFRYIEEESGSPLASDFWFWLPRRRLWFKPTETRGLDKQITYHTWGALGRQDTTWDMFNNKGFQKLVEEFPTWGPTVRMNDVVFRSDIHEKLKKTGFSGFNEASANNYLSQKPSDTVGYIYFNN